MNTPCTLTAKGNAHYGQKTFGSWTTGTRRRVQAHRYAVEQCHGITLELGCRRSQVHHLCGNKLCINPDHLVICTVRGHRHLDALRRMESAHDHSDHS